jgi:hypothetical protein
MTKPISSAKKVENDMKELISKLKSKKIYITENQQKMLDFTGSRVEECLIMSRNEIVSRSKKYRRILIDTWKTMRPEQIRDTSTFNFKLTNENGTNGYNWCSDINMSFQNKDTNHTLDEIVDMVKVNRMSLDISIKLKNGKLVYLKIDS